MLTSAFMFFSVVNIALQIAYEARCEDDEKPRLIMLVLTCGCFILAFGLH